MTTAEYIIDKDIMTPAEKRKWRGEQLRQLRAKKHKPRKPKGYPGK